MWLFAGTGRAHEKDAAVLPNEAGGGQVQDEALRHLGVKGPVIILQPLYLHDAGLLEAPGKEAVAAGGQFVLHQQLQEFGIGQLVVDGLLVTGCQGGDHARQPQVAQLAFQFRIHAITSSVYSDNRRMMSWLWIRDGGAGALPAACSTSLRSVL